MEILVLIGIVGAIALWIWITVLKDRAGRYTDLRKQHDELWKKVSDIDEYARIIRNEVAQERSAMRTELAADRLKLDARERALDEQVAAVQRIATEKSVGFPWLAKAYADFFALEDERIADSLKRKQRPARKSAELVQEAKRRRRDAEIRARVAEYQIQYYESLFPWLVDLKSEDLEDAAISLAAPANLEGGAEEDPAKRWLSEQEYAAMPSAEKFQRALDRYWTSRKSKWQLGRDYERYVGWLYEKDGHAVSYHGIIKGFDDLGRDLLATKNGAVQVVQCKYWSKEKTIHEKHIFQLYGTMVAYGLDNPNEPVSGHFVTSTSLSDRAKKFAEYLGIHVTEQRTLERYPCIKCNISERTQEKIYHLPFDQQYDSTVIEPDRGELFAASVADAEGLGFRRAFRYRGA